MRAGELLRSYVLKRTQNIDISSSLATVIVERTVYDDGGESRSESFYGANGKIERIDQYIDGDAPDTPGSGLDAARAVELRLRSLGFSEVAVAVRSGSPASSDGRVRVTVRCGAGGG